MLTDKQIRVMRMGIRLGRKLQREHPEIAREYKTDTINQIISTHSIPTTYSVKSHIAELAVRFALQGYAGGYDTQPYTGLLDKETLDELCHEHKLAGGLATLRDKKGLFGRTPEKIRADNSTAGKALAAQHKGMFKLTYEERLSLGYANQHFLKDYNDNKTPEQRAADISRIVEAQGKISWVKSTDENPSELEYALSLTALPENHRGSRLNTERISQQLNQRYHNSEQVRNGSSVAAYLSLHRRKQAELT